MRATGELLRPRLSSAMMKAPHALISEMLVVKASRAKSSEKRIPPQRLLDAGSQNSFPAKNQPDGHPTLLSAIGEAAWT